MKLYFYYTTMKEERDETITQKGVHSYIYTVYTHIHTHMQCVPKGFVHTLKVNLQMNGVEEFPVPACIATSRTEVMVQDTHRQIERERDKESSWQCPRLSACPQNLRTTMRSRAISVTFQVPLFLAIRQSSSTHLSCSLTAVIYQSTI